MVTAPTRERRELDSQEERSPARLERKTRFGLAALFLLAAGMGSLIDFSRVLARADPVRAAPMGMSDGRTIAAAAWQRVSQSPNKETRAQAADLARKALRLDPTATDALETLALIAQLENDPAKVGPLHSYSLALSRRQVRSHLWAIEEAVSQGDVKLALHRYDLALRVSEAAQINLFPVLASAAREPLVRRELVNVLASNSGWGGRFLTYVSENSSSAPSAASLFAEARDKGVAIGRGRWVNLVTGLIAQGEYEQAWAGYRQLNPRVDRSRARDPRFTREPDSPFEWTTVSDQMGISASLLAQKGGGRFEVAVSPGSRATALRQLLLLPSGGYRLSGDGELVAGEETPRAYWLVMCKTGRELTRIPIRVQAGGKLGFDGIVAVAPDCPVQELRLDIGSDIGSGESTISLTTVRLEPAMESDKT
jgi:hypothetical protein